MSRMTRHFYLAALSVVITTSAAAQRIGLAAEVAEGSRRSDLDQLRGGRLEFLQPTRAQGLELRYGLAVFTRGGDSFGSTCAGGPILPGMCPPEPIAERRLLALGSFGAGVHTPPRLFGASLYVDALAGAGRIVDRGKHSGQRRRATRGLLGLNAGIEARIAPPASRLQAYAGVALSGVNPFVTQCVDCWMPFGGSFGLRRGYAGIAIRTR